MAKRAIVDEGIANKVTKRGARGARGAKDVHGCHPHAVHGFNCGVLDLVKRSQIVEKEALVAADCGVQDWKEWRTGARTLSRCGDGAYACTISAYCSLFAAYCVLPYRPMHRRTDGHICRPC